MHCFIYMFVYVIYIYIERERAASLVCSFYLQRNLKSLTADFFFFNTMELYVQH